MNHAQQRLLLERPQGWMTSASLPMALWRDEPLRLEALKACEQDARLSAAAPAAGALQLDRWPLAQQVGYHRPCALGFVPGEHLPHLVTCPQEVATTVVVQTTWRVVGPCN